MSKLLVSSIAMSAAMLMTAPVFAQDATPVGDTAVAETPAATDVIAVPEGFTTTSFDAVSADQLTGARLHDDKGADIGEVADLVLGDDGKVTGIVTDIGGFLGMGEHRVLLNPDQLEIYTNADGETRAFVRLTDEELKALPAYEAE